MTERPAVTFIVAFYSLNISYVKLKFRVCCPVGVSLSVDGYLRPVLLYVMINHCTGLFHLVYPTRVFLLQSCGTWQTFRSKCEASYFQPDQHYTRILRHFLPNYEYAIFFTI